MKRAKILILFICLIFLCKNANAFTFNLDADTPRLKALSDEVAGGYKTFDEKVCALREYLHRPPKKTDIKPNGERITPQDIYKMNIIEWLDSGYGAWCDQLSYAFMVLAHYQHITTRMVWLYDEKDAPSCHTIAEAYDGKRWVIIDPLYNLGLLNHEGKMAARVDIKKDMGILRKSESVKELAKENQNWNNDKWLQIYTNPVIIKVTYKANDDEQDSGFVAKIKNYFQNFLQLRK